MCLLSIKSFKSGTEPPPLRTKPKNGLGSATWAAYYFHSRNPVHNCSCNLGKMGGPMILRGAAKAAAGAPCRGIGAIGIVPNPPRCISGVLGSNQNGVVQATSVEVLHEQQGPSFREWEDEGWELTGDEERVEYAVRDHVVFGAPPSKEEAETATADLRIALSSIHAKSGLNTPASSTLNPAPSPPKDGLSSLDWMESPQVHAQKALEFQRTSPAIQAFHLFQTNPNVQDVVVSLASDQNVWAAVLGNPKVRELREKMKASEEYEEAGSTEPKSAANSKESMLDWIVHKSQDAFLGIKRNLYEFFNGLLSFVDKKLDAEKFFDAASDNKGLNTCLMLAILVIGMVIVRRAA